MLNGVDSGALATLLRSGPQASSGQKTSQGTDSFSRQLLSILQNSLGTLGVSAADVKVVQAGEQASTDGAASSSPCQILVTLSSQAATSTVAEEATATTTNGEVAPPEVMYEDHPGWNRHFYATREMAEWLAERFGGEVGTFEFEWSPGFEPPPAGYTVKFGDKEIPAGHLAMYFEPGRFSGADKEAALALFRDGVANDYVKQHRPELIEKYGLPA
ncbi:MAG: hypothetical protein ACE141_01120 [Bryobacteraceae bacterium]